MVQGHQVALSELALHFYYEKFQTDTKTRKQYSSPPLIIYPQASLYYYEENLIYYLNELNLHVLKNYIPVM